MSRGNNLQGKENSKEQPEEQPQNNPIHYNEWLEWTGDRDWRLRNNLELLLKTSDFQTGIKSK